jgi:hypothetical protein
MMTGWDKAEHSNDDAADADVGARRGKGAPAQACYIFEILKHAFGSMPI